MTRRRITGLVALATAIAICGGLMLTPPVQSLYRLWQWTQRYSTVGEARARLKADPDDAKAHQTLAWTLLSSETSGKEVSVEEARHQWEEAIRCAPSNEIVIVIAVPLLYMGEDSTPQQHDKARRLLTPVAEHGNPKLQPEAIKMLQDLQNLDRATQKTQPNHQLRKLTY